MQCHNFEYILNVQQPVTHQNVHYPFHRFSLSLISSFFTNSWRGEGEMCDPELPHSWDTRYGSLSPRPKIHLLWDPDEDQSRSKAEMETEYHRSHHFFEYATFENYNKSASSSKCQSISMTYDYNTMGISRMKRILLSAFMVKYHIAYCYWHI